MQELHNRIMASKGAVPRPREVLHSASVAVADIATPVLHAVYVDTLLDGRAVPPRWNDGIIIFLPQGLDVDRWQVVLMEAAAARPLTLSGTSSRSSTWRAALLRLALSRTPSSG